MIDYRHLYCFVDESGQDTLGSFFLVVAVLIQQEVMEPVQNELVRIEEESGKRHLKWTKASFATRDAFLQAAAKIKGLQGTLYYTTYHETKEYTTLTALTIAKAVLAATVGAKYGVHIIIDGLTKKDTEKIRQELKKLHITYKNIRGMKDEQHPFLRLADCIAGVLRDYMEGQAYATAHVQQFQKRGILIEV